MAQANSRRGAFLEVPRKHLSSSTIALGAAAMYEPPRAADEEYKAAGVVPVVRRYPGFAVQTGFHIAESGFGFSCE